jgi:hypothetical protein
MSSSKRKHSPSSALPFKRPKLPTPKVLLTPNPVLKPRLLQCTKTPEASSKDFIRQTKSCPPKPAVAKLRRPEVYLGLSVQKVDMKSFHITDFGVEEMCQSEVLRTPIKDKFEKVCDK